jgi:8-oxo-dGTP diphosphatase
MLYVGREWSGDPHGVEQQEIGWFSLDQMHDLEMPPADLPLIELLRNQLNG